MKDIIKHKMKWIFPRVLFNSGYLIVEKSVCMRPQIYGTYYDWFSKLTGLPAGFDRFESKEEALSVLKELELNTGSKFKLVYGVGRKTLFEKLFKTKKYFRVEKNKCEK